ncbi:FUSC family protein [Actinomycetospora cinnamomea]|uniref:Putative membrane protein YccC n=1 Tax=Actinomycetospora cinnamomea TaxID=663609 RepID=A0A2U1EXI1_9PSEU|nr:FUSC family protein [Actinomycetospora cinnamomea]PVZ04632.1 putative membrane protein YccC [Actinomycetospora cinnamomea]
MAGRRGLRWLLRRDPGLAASRRALRVAVAATAAFMLCRYAFDSPTAGTYAVFGTIGFGVLSQVVGSPRERTRTLLGCFAAGSVLLTVGTLLAGSTWAASAGMLVVGVVVAFLAVGGPRLGGVANGLQLVYILPSFPPYAPDTLPARVIGFAVGVAFLALADRVLWPPRPHETYASRAAAAARAIADLLDALAARHDGVGRLSGVGAADSRRTAAEHAAGRLKLLATPWEERPTGPGARDRGSAHLGAALRGVQGRVDVLLSGDATTGGAAVDLPSDADETLAATATALRRTADALRGRGRLPDVADLDAARLAYTERRLDTISTIGSGDEAVAHARAAVAVGQILAATRVAVQAATVVVDPRRPRPRGPEPGDLAWWVGAPTTTLWWRRVRAHLSLRSVYLQNAVRLGLGLGLARLVAGGLDLSHGLWVLLATLTLMRTSVTSTRATLVPAIAGTAAGALVAAGLLALAGPGPAVYAVLFPVLCVAAVAAGQLFGAVAGQASFTVLVAVLFAQLAPAGPSLAGMRLLDVVVGAVVGIGVGAAVWPAGGHGEVRRDAARALGATADLVAAAAAWLTGSGTREQVARQLEPADHWLLFFEATFLQYRSERGRRQEDDVDWFVVLGVVHRAIRTARSSFDDPDPATLRLWERWPDLVGLLRHDARALTDGYRAVARALADGHAPAGVLAVPSDFLDRALRALADTRGRREHPRETLRLVDAWGRLGWLADDLVALGVALGPASSAPRPLPA